MKHPVSRRREVSWTCPLSALHSRYIIHHLSSILHLLLVIHNRSSLLCILHPAFICVSALYMIYPLSFILHQSFTLPSSPCILRPPYLYILSLSILPHLSRTLFLRRSVVLHTPTFTVHLSSFVLFRYPLSLIVHASPSNVHPSSVIHSSFTFFHY